eukprot:evm.model.scf_655.2 EVM.evm.TU.scf_655.2   scf_655:32149-39705(-)
MDPRRFGEGLRPAGSNWVQEDEAGMLDVAFVGASLANLASAAALCSAFEGIRVKVYEEAQDLQHVDDFLLTLSSGAWKALSAVSSIATKALLYRGLVYSSGVAPEGHPWESDDSCLPACSLRTLMELLGSLLPAGTLCKGTRLEDMHETPDGVTFKEDGQPVLSKLIVTSPDCTSSDFTVGLLQKTGFIEADIILQLEQACPLETPEWRDGKNVVVWRPLASGTAALSCLLEASMEGTAASLEGILRLLRDFPGLGNALEGSSQIVSWTARDILAPFGAERAESAFTNALLLRCSLADKGLTPAALRDFEGLAKGHSPWTVMDKEAMEDVDWLGVWGLPKNAPPKSGQQPASGDKQKLGSGVCDVAFARGLKSAMPTSGMGWRIMS